MRLMVLVAAFVAMATPVFAGEWRPVAQGDDMVAGIDYSRITDVGGRKQVWVIKSHRIPNHEAVSYTLGRAEFDCNAGTIRRISLAGFTTDGRSVYSMSFPHEIEQVIPDTINDKLMEATCMGRKFWDVPSDTGPALHAYLQREWW